MSVFPESGRSQAWKIDKIRARFRPIAAGGSTRLAWLQRAQTGQYATLTTDDNRRLGQASSSVLLPFRRER